MDALRGCILNDLRDEMLLERAIVPLHRQLDWI